MKQIIKRILKWTLLLAVLAGAVFGVWHSVPKQVPPQFRTAQVTLGNIAQVVTGTGTINPLELVTVGTQVSGQVNQVYVKLNDEVKKGQLLAEIDPAVLKAQVRLSQSSVETARANYEQSKRDLGRTQTLVGKDYLPKVDLERAEQTVLQAKNSYESAQAQLERDEVNLSYTKIISPIDGVIIGQEATLGQTMAASFQTPNLFRIAGSLTQMKIDVNFSESDISKIKKNMPVTFTVDAFPDETFEGRVDVVNLNPNTSQGVVTYTVLVVFENQEKKLLPGMTAYVNIVLSERKDVLRVPASALRFTPPAEYTSGMKLLFSSDASGAYGFGQNVEANTRQLFLVKDGKLSPLSVEVGSTDEILVEVSGGGIAEGDSVATGMIISGRR
jgi:HlyD family secretion protein